MRTLLVLMGILSSLSLMACGSNGSESGAVAQNDGRPVNCEDAWKQYVAAHPQGRVEEYSVETKMVMAGNETRQPARRETTRVLESTPDRVSLEITTGGRPVTSTMTKAEFTQFCGQGGTPASIPADANAEVLARSRQSVTVPAGTFDCDYVKVKTTMSGMESIMETWTDRNGGAVIKQVVNGNGRGMQMLTVKELVRRG